MQEPQLYALRPPKQKPLFLNFRSTNGFTSNSTSTPRAQYSFIPGLLRLQSIKEQQKESLANISNRNRDGNQTGRYFVAKNGRPVLEKIKENIFVHISSPQYNHSKNEILSPISRIHHRHDLSLFQNRKTNSSFLQKCRIVTENYDQLKKQVVSKLHIKSNRSCSKQNHQSDLRERSKNQLYQNHKQNEYESEYTGARNRNRVIKYRKKHKRYHSQTKQGKGVQRYMEISVADFMEESQTNISTGMSKRFQQFRKEAEAQREVRK